MTNDERRTTKSLRVPVGTLVEICGNEPGIPAFEAESVDVSARGMHVRTAYLPELGAPLVCRFEDRGREIVVEGSVAWRKEGAKGGEFGMQFTALDSGSVDALRDLCGVPESPPPPDAKSEELNGASSRNAPGSRVRLHIDGLGSPMKARVRGASERSVQVGSNLEFLKVGRRLEVEDLEAGSKRGANIDSVSVAIDPSTQIPQLVVVLRYDDGSETTPEPSVIDSEVGATHRSPIAPAHVPSSERAASGSADTEALEDEEVAAAELSEEDDVAEEANALRGRLAVAATNAGVAVQKTGAILGRFGVSAAAGVGKLFKGASERVIEYRRQRDGKTEPRRTAPPPSGVLSVEGRRLRPQSSRAGGAVEEEQAPVPKSNRVKRAAIGAAIAVLLITVSVIAMRKPAPPPGAEASAAPAVAVASAENVTRVDEQGNPVDPSKPPLAASLKSEPGLGEQGGGVSADVPLFGPTPMATMEPAPLGPAPEQGAPAEGSEEAAEKAAAAAPEAEDEAWQEPGDQPSQPKARPEDVEPWGRGNLQTPTIHRLRLDGAGTSIQGAINPTGFTVVIPGRKVMESGGAIEKRDKRIARVRTKNVGSGAQIALQFRDGVPAYRVRLRRDYVEILISAPPEKPTPAVQHAKSSMQPKKGTPKALQKKQTAKPVAKKPLAKIAKPKKG